MHVIVWIWISYQLDQPLYFQSFYIYGRSRILSLILYTRPYAVTQVATCTFPNFLPFRLSERKWGVHYPFHISEGVYEITIYGQVASL